MTSEQIKYVASHLCLAQLDIAQLRPLQVFDFDPTWTNPHCDNPTVQSYYVLPIPQFKSRLDFGDDIPPKPRRALRPDGSDAIEHIQLVHATSSGGLRGILTEAKLRPSKLHQTDSCSFFAIGYRKSYDPQHDRWETARVLNSGWQANKNAAKILVLCLGWGDGKNFKEGGEAPCIEHTRHGGICHHWRAKFWVCSTKTHYINALAWKCDATPPAEFLP